MNKIKVRVKNRFFKKTNSSSNAKSYNATANKLTKKQVQPEKENKTRTHNKSYSGETGKAASVGNNNNFEKSLENVQNMYARNMEIEKAVTENVVKNTKNGIYEVSNRPLSPLFTNAGANLQDALHDFKYAKNNEHAHILNSRSEVKNKDINKILDKAHVPQNSRGVYYDINSEQSKKLFNSKEIQQIVNDLKNNRQPNLEEFGFSGSNNIDNHLALQHCTLHNLHITDDSYFEVTIIDYYDFAYRKPMNIFEIKSRKDLEKNIFNDINNWGFEKQEKGKLENYFVIYSIREKL